MTSKLFNQNDLELIERLVKTLTDLNNTTRESNNTIKTVAAHFTNGFRAEIKEHMTTELEELKSQNISLEKGIKENQDKSEKIVKEIKSFKSVGFWLKLFAGFVISIGATAVAVSQILRLIP